jgi:alkaline phosphatase
MKNLLFGLLFCVSSAFAQSKFTHSHNDYNQTIPFYRAFYAGFNSIEADIFVEGGRLLVSHNRKDLSPERSLKELYLDPLLYAMRRDTSRRVCLLIDVKEEYGPTLAMLIRELEPLRSLLMTKEHAGRLKILISGNQPLPASYKDYPDYLFFDANLLTPHTKAEWERVGQVSLDFSKYSKWKGEGNMPDEDKHRIKHTIDSVHTNTGKLVRFWGGPDIERCWNVQIDLGADIIGTDHIEELANYLQKKNMRQPGTAAIPAYVKFK